MSDDYLSRIDDMIGKINGRITRAPMGYLVKERVVIINNIPFQVRHERAFYEEEFTLWEVDP